MSLITLGSFKERRFPLHWSDALDTPSVDGNKKELAILSNSGEEDFQTITDKETNKRSSY